MRALYILFFLLSHAIANAQLGSWTTISLKTNINNRFTLFSETQLRSLKFYNNFHYYEFIAGTAVNINKNFSFICGIGRYDTYSEGGNFKTPKVNNELRTWVQINMKQYLDRIKFEHRYRAEQRWTINGYRNRFRYRFQTVVPINKKKLEKGTFYFTAWDEIFFTSKEPFFERNRWLLGAGYEVSDNLAIQSGFVSQFDYNLNDETGRKFFQISFLYELAIRRNKQEHVPGGID